VWADKLEHLEPGVGSSPVLLEDLDKARAVVSGPGLGHRDCGEGEGLVVEPPYSHDTATGSDDDELRRTAAPL
jgi:hypothetical protein